MLEGDEYGNRRGIPLKVKLKRTDRQRRGVAEQIRAGGVKSANAAVLNDYRHWVNHIGGLDLGYE